MERSVPDLLQAVGDAVIRCKLVAPGPELAGAKEQLRAAIRELAPALERQRNFRGRGAVHEIADRWLSGVEVARLLAWDGEPVD